MASSNTAAILTTTLALLLPKEVSLLTPVNTLQTQAHGHENPQAEGSWTCHPGEALAILSGARLLDAFLTYVTMEETDSFPPLGHFSSYSSHLPK